MEQLVTHLVTEHWDESWHDEEFDSERGKVERIAREHKKRWKRERTEAEMRVPRLPAMCSSCQVQCKDAKQWKYHVLAHKYGEVFCSTCLTCVLGHQFTDHKAGCLKSTVPEQRVKVDQYMGHTWLDVDGKKLKVSFEYAECKERGTIAKCVVKDKPNQATHDGGGGQSRGGRQTTEERGRELLD